MLACPLILLSSWGTPSMIPHFLPGFKLSLLETKKEGGIRSWKDVRDVELEPVKLLLGQSYCQMGC